MDRLRENLQKHREIAWVALLGYLIFNGCFVFPFSNELFPFSFNKGIMVVSCYGIIGMCFVGLLPQNKGLWVFFLSLICTAIGMGCRYLLEYGEVSNARNFIPVNIASFLLVVPAYCMAVYWAIYHISGE